MPDSTDTFRKHELFLVGANGFVGKVLLGMLLDRFEGAKRLYILVRPRPGVPAHERFEREVLASPALAPIVRKFTPEFLRSKIKVIPGDISHTDCGISAEDWQCLNGRVSLVLNCAGLVDFFPPVTDSFRSNVDGVENLIDVTKRLGAKLLHVSTCYVCGEGDGLIEETEAIAGFYPRRKGPEDCSFDHRAEIAYCREKIRQISASAEGDDKHVYHQKLIDFGKQRAEHWGWVNTYTFSKSLGEQLLAAETDLDYAIVRPAIVESALQFPFPGWVEGGQTAAPLVGMAMSGLRHWTVRPNSPLEVVPVDLIAAATLAVSVLLLNGCNEKVYQLGTADTNPVRLGWLVRILRREYRRSRRRALAGGPCILSARQFRARQLRIQKRLRGAQNLLASAKKGLTNAGLPRLHLFDSCSTVLRALELRSSFRQQIMELYQPFILQNRYIFESENIRAAYALLSHRDRELLPWNPEQIRWDQYWAENEIKGIAKWVHTQTPDAWAFKV